MRELQAKIIEEMGVQPRIDPAGEVRKRVTFLKEYLKATHTKGFVLGISGGLDSSLAGRLAQLAVEELEAEGVEANFVAVRLPYGVQHDEDDAQAALDFIRAKTEWTFNISAAVDGFEDEFEKTVGNGISDFHKGNTKARTRMIAQYALAGEHNYLVIGTDHGAESVTGFFTKFGDGGADILPLFGLNKRQNRALLAELGAPARIWEKVPTADLLDGKPGRTDEDELGISYDQIDDYLEGRDVPDAVAEPIEQKYLRTRHKRTVPVTIFDTWWKSQGPEEPGSGCSRPIGRPGHFEPWLNPFRPQRPACPCQSAPRRLLCLDFLARWGSNYGISTSLPRTWPARLMPSARAASVRGIRSWMLNRSFPSADSRAASATRPSSSLTGAIPAALASLPGTVVTAAPWPPSNWTVAVVVSSRQRCPRRR